MYASPWSCPRAAPVHFSLPQLEESGVASVSRLPLSIRILLESVLRNLDGRRIRDEDALALAAWQPQAPRVAEAVSVLVFPIASMLAIGLSFTLRQIVGPLRHLHRVFRALVANFVLVPLLALGISRLLALDPPLAAGLMLVGTAAGAPFLIKLTKSANADTGLSATLLVLLMPVTVLYMPLVVPLVVADASVSAMSIALPLIATLLLPLAVGLVLDSVVPTLAARLGPIAAKASSVALLVLIASTLVLNAPLFRDLLGTGAITAAVLLTAGGFGVGYLLSGSGFDRRTVMGLGAGQRNIAAALVVASQGFDDPNTLIMVVLFSLIDLMVLFPIAWMLRRRSPRRLPPEARGDAHRASTLPEHLDMGPDLERCNNEHEDSSRHKADTDAATRQ